MLPDDLSEKGLLFLSSISHSSMQSLPLYASCNTLQPPKKKFPHISSSLPEVSNLLNTAIQFTALSNINLRSAMWVASSKG